MGDHKSEPIKTEIYLAGEHHRGVIKDLLEREKKVFGFVRQATIDEAIANKRVWAAYHATGMIVGFIIFYHCKRKDHTSIRKLFVRSPYRRQGIGKRLMATVYEDARREGKKTLRLSCPVDSDAANAFYKGTGFALSETVKGNKRELNVWTKRVG